MSLQTGQAIVFAPSGLGVKGPATTSVTTDVIPLGQGYLFVWSRQRITADGGHSILACGVQSSVPIATENKGHSVETNGVETYDEDDQVSDIDDRLSGWTLRDDKGTKGTCLGYL